MTQLRKRNQVTGASLLLETIFGIGLFSISLLLLFSIFPTAHKSMGQAKNYSMALNLARWVMEENVRARPFANVVNLGPVPVTLNTRVNGELAEEDFEYTVIVSPTADVDLRHVRVLIQWTEGAIDREVRLETYVANL